MGEKSLHFLWKSIPKTEFCIFYLSNSNYWEMSKKSLKVYMYLMKFYRVNVYHPGRETVYTLLIFTTGDKLLAFNPIIFNLQNGHDIFQICLKFKFFEQRLWPTLLKSCLKG